MSQIKIKFINCYGIGQLEENFDFGGSTAYSIYAPNGFMKTSLSKTFLDFSKGVESSDLIHKDRPNTRHIKNAENDDIDPKSILVIQPYDQDYISDKTATLMVNQAIRAEYDQALTKIELRKTSLEKALRKISGLSKTVKPESEILKCFGSSSIYELLESLQAEINSYSDGRLSKLDYSSIFNEKRLHY